MRRSPRWVRFGAVGAAGFALQTLALWLFAERAGVPYLGAVILALELAILHNYIWHARWTWRDRLENRGGPGRLGRYHAATGLTALANVACVVVLVETGVMSYLPASVIAVGVCALLNFALADAVVFIRATGRAGATKVSVADGIPSPAPHDRAGSPRATLRERWQQTCIDAHRCRVFERPARSAFRYGERRTGHS